MNLLIKSESNKQNIVQENLIKEKREKIKEITKKKKNTISV